MSKVPLDILKAAALLDDDAIGNRVPKRVWCHVARGGLRVRALVRDTLHLRHDAGRLSGLLHDALDASGGWTVGLPRREQRPALERSPPAGEVLPQGVAGAVGVAPVVQIDGRVARATLLLLIGM